MNQPTIDKFPGLYNDDIFLVTELGSSSCEFIKDTSTNISIDRVRLAKVDATSKESLNNK